jgi:hypothetical protein
VSSKPGLFTTPVMLIVCSLGRAASFTPHMKTPAVIIIPAKVTKPKALSLSVMPAAPAIIAITADARDTARAVLLTLNRREITNPPANAAHRNATIQPQLRSPPHFEFAYCFDALRYEILQLFVSNIIDKSSKMHGLEPPRPSVLTAGGKISLRYFLR